MSETDDRLAPVSYLFGASAHQGAGHRSSASDMTGDTDTDGDIDVDDITDEPGWNDAWGSEVDDSCARLSDAEVERISMRALSRRSLSRRELERVLRDAGIAEEAVTAEVDRLSRVALLDDTALAQTLVASLQERKGLGRSAIAAELAKRLLAPSAIAYALELVDTGEELARAGDLARKRAAQLTGLDRDTAARRLSGYLARRGYSGSTARAAIDQALAPAQTTTVRFR